MSDWLKDQLDQFVRDDVTVGNALFLLGGQLLNGTVNENKHDEFMLWVRDNMMGVDDYIGSKHEIVEIKPELEKLEVGVFVRDYDGASVDFSATCETRCYIAADGDLVFEDTRQGTECIVGIKQLLERATRLREQYDAKIAEWEVKNVHTPAISAALVGGHPKDGPCSTCEQDIKWDAEEEIWRNPNDTLHTCNDGGKVGTTYPA